MRTSGIPSRPRADHWSLAPLLAVLLGAGGCTLLVGAQLSDKPEETTDTGDGGSGGQGGAALASTTAAGSTGSTGVSAGPSSTSSSSTSTSVSSSSGMTTTACAVDLADCDMKMHNGCEANIKTDNKNCGACGNKCTDGKKCKEKVCQ